MLRPDVGHPSFLCLSGQLRALLQTCVAILIYLFLVLLCSARMTSLSGSGCSLSEVVAVLYFPLLAV